jgi:hypothetical protein
VAQLQAFLECVSTASLTCSTSTTIEAPSCMSSELTLADCISPGVSTSSNGASP